MPLAQLAEPWPKMELVQLETENGQSTAEDGVAPGVKVRGNEKHEPFHPCSLSVFVQLCCSALDFLTSPVY
ncbi:hypothetical protein MHYP_G00142520 [Metynnis hypsauchen]